MIPDRIGHAVPVQSHRNRRHWLAKRRRGITATDVPAILGLSPFATPVDVWLDKTGRAEAKETTYAMERGIALESLLLGEYERTTTGATMLTVPVLAGHPDNPLALASLDGAANVDGDTRIVEVKTTSWRGRDDWWADDVPDHYVAQVSWQLYVCGLDSADMIADVAGEPIIVRGVQRSPEWEAYVVPLLHEWWQRHVLADVAPPADAIRDWDHLKLLWKPRPGISVPAGDDALWAASDYLDALAAEKRATEAKKRAGLVLREALAGADELLDPDGIRLASIDARGTLRVKPPKKEKNT